MTEQPIERAAPQIARLQAALEGWAIEAGQQTERAMRAEAALDAMTARCRESAAALERRQAEIEDLTDRVEALEQELERARFYGENWRKSAEYVGQEIVKARRERDQARLENHGLRERIEQYERGPGTVYLDAAATPGAGPLVGEG